MSRPSPIAHSSAVSPRGQPRGARRILILYFVAIVGPCLALLYLGYLSFQRQRDAVATLTLAAQRLQAERLASELEARVESRARAALLDPRLSPALHGLDWTSPEGLHHLREILDAVCRAHPTCADLFVVVGADLGLPRMDEPLPRLAEHVAAQSGRPLPPSALTRWNVAVRREQDGNAGEALRIYRELASTVTEPGLHALALAGVARIQSNLDAEEAVESWARLAGEHADRYDLANRPYALVAALELLRLTKGRQGIAAPNGVVDSIRRDFVTARWPVTPGQAHYFAARLGLVEQTARDSSASSRLFAQFAIATAVRRHLAGSGVPEAGQVRPFQAGTSAQPRQLYLASIPDAAGTPSTLAMDVDLLDVAREWATATADGQRPKIVAARDATPFRTAFRFWSIEWPAPAGKPWWASDVILFGGTTASVLGVLMLGVVMLLRDVARDAATTQLQSDLVSGVSHELKTPLSVIRLYAESLADDLAGSDDAKAEHSRVIVHESERLAHLVERVLEYSRQRVAPSAYQLERHDPVALVKGFVVQYGPYLAHLGFTPTLDLAAGTPDIDADAAALTQVLVNLVDNAVKYSGDARTLVLRVRPLNASVSIEVQDRGVGIPEAERWMLFHAFRRGTHTAGRGGYGLGLHLVSQIITAHGGRVDVDAPDEGGTCVRLTLPVAAPVKE